MRGKSNSPCKTQVLQLQLQNGFHIICSEYVVSKPFAFTCCQFIQNCLHTTEFALDVGRENMANAIAVIK